MFFLSYLCRRFTSCGHDGLSECIILMFNLILFDMKMFFLVIVAVLIGGAALCFSNRTNSGAESDLFMENVEALSESEHADCKLYLTRICTSGNKDHYFYRTVK